MVDCVCFIALDKADRLLDMGFSTTLNPISEGLPTRENGRQTLRFSATQTRDLARLSLNEPQYLAVCVCVSCVMRALAAAAVP